MIGSLLVDRGARFSDCKRYRYELWRKWSNVPPYVFLMLNPSTADEETNDPTVERCERRAYVNDAGGLIVVNLFAWRSTDPKLLPYVDDPVGADNDDAIRRACSTPGAVVVCGWGRHGRLRDRDRAVLKLLTGLGVQPLCLGQNKDGTPWHPLYVPYETEPRPYPIQASNHVDR